MLVGSCVVIGIGVALLLSASLGADGYSTLQSGIAIWSGWPFAVGSALLGVSLVAMAWARGIRPGSGTIVATVFVGVVISLGLDVLPEPDALWARALLVLVAFPVLTVGVAGYLGADLGAGPVEAAAMAWDPPVPFRWSYSAVQGGGALVGWLLGATIGPVTVLMIFLLGPAVDLLSRRFLLFRIPPRRLG